jgi:hypothetical protein
VTPDEFLQAYYAETRRRMYCEPTPFSELLAGRCIHLGDDPHGDEVLDRLSNLPLLAQLFDGVYQLRDGGRYVFLIMETTDAGRDCFYFAVPKMALQELPR